MKGREDHSVCINILIFSASPPDSTRDDHRHRLLNLLLLIAVICLLLLINHLCHLNSELSKNCGCGDLGLRSMQSRVKEAALSINDRAVLIH